ncbi:MAG: hypothetical protein ACRD4F_13035, partial [Candidatus Angelobacter sp.]
MNNYVSALRSGLQPTFTKLGIMTVATAALVLTGCGSKTTPPAPPAAQAQGKLYVAVPFSPPTGNGAIVRFDNPSALSGSIAPSASITGDLTLLNMPEASMALDTTADRMFALVPITPTTAAILVFDDVSTKSGNFAPDRVITGSATGLIGTGPLVVDGAKDIVYAESGPDAGGNAEILTSKNASTASGNVAPSSILRVGPAGIAAIDMVLDGANDRLFLLMNDQAVRVLD